MTVHASKTLITPKTGYVLLWFPLASETFIFREVQRLAHVGLPVHVFTMYGAKTQGCSEEMRTTTLPIMHYGIRSFFPALFCFMREFCRRPRTIWPLFRDCLLRKLRSWETRGETFLCFLFGFLLAEDVKKEKIDLLHAAWGNGPATAAWVASRLSGIPFSFTGRAGDIHPQDGILALKARDALFLRANNAATVSYLQTFCDVQARDKVHLVYNGLTLGKRLPSAVPYQKPFRLLSIGRFVPKKGFDILLSAMARLRREGVSVQLTLVGDGRLRRALERQYQSLCLCDCVTMPGFVPNDHVLALMQNHDIFVMPSVESTTGDRDGIPNVIMEALSCCMPVIASDVNGISEVIVHGETGFLVPQRDPTALANAIREMLANREQALRLATMGRNRVLSMFDSQKNTQQLLELYISAYAQYSESKEREA